MSNGLLMPMAGYREFDGSPKSGAYGRYWSSSPYSSYAYGLHFSASNLYPQNNYYRAHAFSVRCFKNSIVVPSVSSVLYAPDTWTSGSVTVTVTLDQTAGSVAGWTSSGTTFTKMYSTNTTENVTFQSTLGGMVSTDITVSNIDTTPPTISEVKKSPTIPTS
jgi:hypothetical protein